MKLIFKDDTKTLIKCNTKEKDLNYLVEFDSVEIDKKIGPIHLVSFNGKIDIIKLFMMNKTIDIDFETEPSKFTPL